MSRVWLFNKPYGVICQFSRDGLHPTPADFISVPGFYPAGRPDTDSEGLLLLTDDGQVAASNYRSEAQTSQDLLGAIGRGAGWSGTATVAQRGQAQ